MRKRTTQDAYAHAIFAAPVAIWLGLLANNIIRRPINELGILMFWHTLLFFYLVFGSLAISAPFALIIRKLPKLPIISSKFFWASVIAFGGLCAYFFILGMESSSVEGSGSNHSSWFLFFGVSLNMLFFTKFIKENET